MSKWEEHHPWPTVGTLRGFVFNAENNGADVWIVRVGRRVLIDEAAFFEWARTIGGKAAKPGPGKKTKAASDHDPEAA